MIVTGFALPFLGLVVGGEACCRGLQSLSSWEGIEPMPSAVEVWSPNHWTAR